MKKILSVVAGLCIGFSGIAQTALSATPGAAKDCCEKVCDKKDGCKKKCTESKKCNKNSGKSLDAKEAWATLYPQIEKSIQAPTFRDKDYKIFDYGKKSKTKGFLYTELINKVIDLCSREGGGRVIIPKGTWLTGPITLKSNVNLHLEEGATLLFSDDPSQ